MRTINNVILRSILGIVLGLVLVIWPDAAVIYLVIMIGIFFLIPGLYSLLTYILRDRKKDPDKMFPLDAAGSIILGAILIIMPGVFVNILMYLLGALLVLGGIQEIAWLINARKWAPVPWFFYIIPTLIFITGLVILAYPFRMMVNTFIIFGVASIIYGFSELLNWYKFRPEKYPEL